MLKDKLKKIVLLSLVAIGMSTPAFAQSGNLPYVDSKFIHFGFSLGFNTMDFGIDPATAETAVNVSSLKPGFSVGIISDMRMTRYLNLRFTPTLHFVDRDITFKTTASEDIVSLTSIPFSLPLYLKYSAERKGNYRPYLIFGGGAHYDFGRKTSEVQLVLKPVDFFAEVGVGCDIYFSFFKLAPELKFGIGFNDMLDRNIAPSNPDDAKYALAISKLTSRMLTLSFNFE